jgi:patatin-like phospholipase/acyl hydrolase
MAKPMRILSVDGGGIRGLIPASVLVEVESMLQAEAGPDARLADHFDLMAGTSTGGLITGLLLLPEGAAAGDIAADPRPALGAQDVVDFYLDKADLLFRRSRWDRIRRWGALTDERYGNDGFEQAMVDMLGPRRVLADDVRVSQLLRPTVIPTYNATTSRPYFFKQHRAGESDGLDFAVRDMARATAAAPTYFEPVQIASTMGDLGTCLDGGLFANNPALCAYTEAHSTFNHSIDDIAILSIGTGTNPPSYTHDQIKDWGIGSWARPMIDIMLVGSERTVDHHLDQLFGSQEVPGSTPYLRLQADLAEAHPDTALMDNIDPENLDRLVAIGKDVVAQQRGELERFVHDHLLVSTAETSGEAER